jgi:hypothetical protein
MDEFWTGFLWGTATWLILSTLVTAGLCLMSRVEDDTKEDKSSITQHTKKTDDTFRINQKHQTSGRHMGRDKSCHK